MKINKRIISKRVVIGPYWVVAIKDVNQMQHIVSFREELEHETKYSIALDFYVNTCTNFSCTDPDRCTQEFNSVVLSFINIERARLNQQIEMLDKIQKEHEI